jgi:CheY-like chemotaxis protein
MWKLLLVEDNELNRDMLARRLERRGYQVIVAVDGQQGLCMTQAEMPDLVLMDLSLPMLDGLEVTRRLKAQVTTQSIPVIALTAHAMVGDQERCLAAGCDDYDTKPVDFQRLLAKIHTLLHGKVCA